MWETALKNVEKGGSCPLASWLMAEGSGVSVADDTGNGYPLALTNADQWFTDPSRGTTVKSTAGRTIRQTPLLSPSGAIVLFTEVYVEPSSPNFSAVISKAISSVVASYRFFIDIGSTGTEARFGYVDASGSFQLATITGANLKGVWTKIAVAWTPGAGVAKRFASINGLTVTAVSTVGDFTEPLTANDTATTVLGNYSDNAIYGEMRFKKAEICNIELTQDELNTLTS